MPTHAGVTRPSSCRSGCVAVLVQACVICVTRSAPLEANGRGRPAKAREQPYKALVENDQAWLASLLDHVPELAKGIGEAYEGITVETFEQAVQQFSAMAAHPTLGLPHPKVGYRPARSTSSVRTRFGDALHAACQAARSWPGPPGSRMLREPGLKTATRPPCPAAG
jgi:hypothetical protein